MAQLQFDLEDLQELVKTGKKEAMDTLTMLGFPTEETEDGQLNVEVTPNRPDCLCVEGLARVLKCHMSGKPAPYKIGKSDVSVVVDKSVLQVRPSFAAAVVKNVKMTDSLLRSLMQVQEKLHETLGRKRRKADIGIYDLDTVEPPFRYFACGRKDVSFVPLESSEKMTPEKILERHPKGISYAHLVGERCPMITDRNGKALSFPPIINSEDTKLNGKTRNLFIESTGSSDDASGQCVNIICAMLADRGGKVEGIKINGNAYPLLQESRWKVPVKEAEKLLGIKLGVAQAGRLLSKMGHRVVGNSVYVPGYRTDVMNAVDLIEDIAIAYGFNNFEPRLPDVSTVGKGLAEPEYYGLLLGLGFEEVVTWTLANPSLAAKAKLPRQQAIEIENPLTEDFTIFRQALLPNLLAVLSEGKNEKLPIKVYELGPVGTPGMQQRLAIASMHPKASFSEIKGVVQALAESLGKKLELVAEEFGPFVKGRCAAVYLDGKKTGYLGEIAPGVLADFNLEQPSCAAEFSV